MQETLRCIHISFDQASIGIREKVALSTEEILRFLQHLKNKDFALEFFLLSTCNRTEFYYVSTHDLKDAFIRELSEFKGALSLLEYGTEFAYEADPVKAVERLFLVSNGVLSTILGDLQIIRQIKNAYGLACQAGTAGPYLHRLLQLVFASHKDVTTNTGIHMGGASVSTVAADLAVNFEQKNKDSHVLIIGAGEFSREVIEQLKKKKRFLKISIMNRNEVKSRKLASQFGLNSRPLDKMIDLSEFDVIISCISSAGFFFNSKNFEARPHGQKLIIDLSVPRVFDPALSLESGLKLVNIDQITESNKQALQKRKESIPDVLGIIQPYSQEFLEWQISAMARPLIHNFKNIIEGIRLQEVNRHLKKHKDTVDPELVEQITKSIVNKIIKMPAISLTRSSHENETDLKTLGEALIRLFDLKMANKHVTV